jgi:hypothetical protein
MIISESHHVDCDQTESLECFVRRLLRPDDWFERKLNEQGDFEHDGAHAPFSKALASPRPFQAESQNRDLRRTNRLGEAQKAGLAGSRLLRPGSNCQRPDVV